MRTMIRSAAAGAMALLLACSVHAQSLIGETLTFDRAYPTPTTPFWPTHTKTTTVVAGASDLIDWYEDGTSGFHLTIDPEAGTIVFKLITPSSWLGLSSVFDGFRITGFSSDIASASVVANDSGLRIATSFTGRVLDIDLNGSNFGGATGFTIATAVPEPSTWGFMIFGVGLIGAIARRRQRAQA